VLLVAALVTLSAAPGVLRLKLRTDGHALVSARAPEVIYDKQIRDQFGIEDQLVVLVRSNGPDGIFNPRTLQLVRDLTAELAKLPGVNPSNVMSLATEPSFRSRPGSLLHQKLLEPPLQTEAELDQLRDDLRRIELYTGTLVANDGKSTVILVGVPAEGDRTALYRRVEELIASERVAPDNIAVTGAPVGEALLGIHILEDLGVPGRWLGVSTRAPSEEPGKWPKSFYDLRRVVAHRVGLVPVAVVVMMLVFLLSFRNALAMLLPLPGVAATLVFVFGMMGWSGVPIYLTLAVMPVLLTATGVTNDVYLFNRYFTLLREKPDGAPLELLEETFDKMVRPVANTSLTTAAGFLSFGFSPIGPVRAFGLCTGLGVLFGLVYSCTVLPALLALIPSPWLQRRRPATVRGPSSLAPWFAVLGQGVVRRRWWVFSIVVLGTAVTPWGLRQLVVQDSWTDAFEPSSEFRRATQFVNEHFHGMHLLLVSFDLPKMLTGELTSSAMNRDGIVLRRDLVANPALIAGSWIRVSSGDKAANDTNQPPAAVWQSHIEMAYGLGANNIATRVPRRDMPTNLWENFSRAGQVRFEVVLHSHVRPEIIRALAELGSFIREHRQYAVGGVLTPADYLSTTRFMARSNDPTARVLPDDPAEIKLMWEYFGLALGQARLHQLVDTNFWRSLTTVFLKDANFVDTAKLMKEIRSYERERLAPQGIHLGFAGDVAVSQSLIQGIVTTQLQSLFWSLLGIYAITTILGGSWRWGLYCVLPSALAVLMKLAVMGWLGIPLGVATSMFAAMTLGIGVNCAIQLLEGFGLARVNETSVVERLSRDLALTGPPALVNTIAVSLGFGVLMLSQVPANARLGLLVVLGLVECFVLSVLLLPVLLYWWPLRSNTERPTGEESGHLEKLAARP
jgi:predicted RND superfamily exporter protein